MSKARTRRKRRQARAAQKWGVAAKPRHALKSGRTGIAHSKKTAPKKREAYVAAPARSLAEAVRCAQCGARPGELHNHGGIKCR